MNLTKAMLLPAMALLLWNPASGASKEDVVDRLNESADILSKVMAAPDKGIPQDLLEKAHCIVLVPDMKKGALIVGAKYGKGFISCREGSGWSAPGAVKVEGGSVGFQIGVSEADLVLLVMNADGAKKLLSSEFTLGGEAAAVAGPVGRTSSAQTDLKLGAGILSYSRAAGVFAGIALEGATLRQDTEDNEALYGKEISNADLVNTKVAFPPAAVRLQTELKKYSPHEK
jgi:lipid-binding SYLF domain-containing protein